ncbi:MAG: lysophospholipid acyltransferase family protein [Steroidobacteraceae bacterium]
MDSPQPQPSRAKSRKPTRSKSRRELTPGRVLLYRLAVWIGYLYVELVWRTARLRVVNEGSLRALVAQHGAVIPVCWHQHLLLCGRYTVTRRRHGIKPGFMISPSVDGEAPTWLAQRYGAHVVRGSGSYTGVRAVRGVYQALVKDKISALITPDGPRGPRFEFKPGAIFSAQISGVPIVPLAFAAKPARVLKTWDKFVLPLPFSRVVIGIGEAVHVPRELEDAQRDELTARMPRVMHETYKLAAAALANG